MTSNNSVPGLSFPTQKSFQPGAGNPRDSSIQSMNNNSQLQTQANKSLSGGRLRRKKSHKRYRGGNTNSTVPVPQYQMPYEPQGGPGTNPNSQIQFNSQTSTQGVANSNLDIGATQMGGRRRRSRKGGNPDWIWGCMNGGKKKFNKSRRTYGKRSRKHRKTHKYRKH